MNKYYIFFIALASLISLFSSQPIQIQTNQINNIEFSSPNVTITLNTVPESIDALIIPCKNSFDIKVGFNGITTPSNFSANWDPNRLNITYSLRNISNTNTELTTLAILNSTDTKLVGFQYFVARNYAAEILPHIPMPGNNGKLRIVVSPDKTNATIYFNKTDNPNDGYAFFLYNDPPPANAFLKSACGLKSAVLPSHAVFTSIDNYTMSASVVGLDPNKKQIVTIYVSRAPMNFEMLYNYYEMKNTTNSGEPTNSSDSNSENNSNKLVSSILSIVLITIISLII